MLIRFIYLFIVFGTLSVRASETPVSTICLLELYLQTDTTYKPGSASFISFLGRLEEKRKSFNNDSDFLRHVFYKGHRLFLKQYKPHSSFSELIQNGSYNCLTGTAFYALVFHHFQIPYTIIETNYHIFVLVTLHNKDLLIEATDPLNGFVCTKKEIDQRIAIYKKNEPPVSIGIVDYRYSFNFWEPVSLEAIVGLLYFNKSVDYYNNRMLENSIYTLVQSAQYRSSERVIEFAFILSATLSESNLVSAGRNQLASYLQIIQKNQLQHPPVMAGL